MTYARLRKDLADQDLLPALWNEKEESLEENTFFCSTALYECFQPDAWNDCERNLLMVTEEGVIFYGNSIDFDFVDFMTGQSIIQKKPEPWLADMKDFVHTALQEIKTECNKTDEDMLIGFNMGRLFAMTAISRKLASFEG